MMKMRFSFTIFGCTYAVQQFFPTNFPALAAGGTQPGMEMVIFSTEPAAFERAGSSLRAIGLDAQQTDHRRITAGVIDFTMTFIKVFRPRND
jgi:hypothetical protein